MKIISNKNKLIKLIQKEKNIGFVPTMGGIHLGHISLIKRSLCECNKTIVSIFINKPQFNKKSDFDKYPRVRVENPVTKINGLSIKGNICKKKFVYFFIKSFIFTSNFLD